MRILIADDHPFTLMGTKAFVESLGYTVEDICSNGITALNLIRSHQPDIAILDINMPGIDGLEVLEKVYKGKLKIKIVLLTMHNEITVFNRAKEFGVSGYILKENASEELNTCLLEVIKGNQYVSTNLQKNLYLDSEKSENEKSFNLTFTERKILELVGEQKTSKQIGEMLFISEKTVEGHRTRIIQKLGLPKEKNTLLIWAMKHLKK